MVPIDSFNIPYWEAAKVLNICLDEVHDQVLLLMKEEQKYWVEYRWFETLDLIRKVPIKLYDVQRVYALKYDPHSNRLIIFLGQSVILADGEGKILQKIEREDGVIGGGFLSNGNLWLEMVEDWGGHRSFGIWDLPSNQICEYKLENFNSYSRVAVLHPSEKLVFTTWNDQSNGLLIHFFSEGADRLLYLKDKEFQLKREEMENVAFSLNSIGDRFVCVLDPNGGPQPVLAAIYSIFDQTSPEIEIPVRSVTYGLPFEFWRASYFLLEQYLMLVGRNRIDLIRIPEVGKNRKVKHPEWNGITMDLNGLVAVDLRRGWFVYLYKFRLYRCKIEDVAKEIEEARVSKMEKFLEDVIEGKYEAKGVSG